MIFADLELARRLESLEAHSGTLCLEAEQRLRSECGATWLDAAGGRALFEGVGSPITQAFGVGLQGSVSEAEMELLEDFFRSRRSPVFLEMCPHADMSVFGMLGRRGYRVIELSNVLFRELSGSDLYGLPAKEIEIRRAKAADAEVWARTTGEGFFGREVPENMLEMFRTFFQADTRKYLVQIGGRPAGSAGMAMRDADACLFGDSTLEAWRGKRIQSSLISARLSDARDAGCHLAMAATLPGSTSQRNYERAGFRIAYTRTKFTREWL